MRSAVRKATLIMVSLVASSVLQGQTAGHIRGTVVDDGGKPLAGVQVEAKHASQVRTTKTGKDGQFRFSMIPPGTYKVRFSLLEYSEVEKNATVRLDATATVDAKLFRLSSETSSGN
jgi:iron complex outermembrane receptor protein